MGDVRELVLGLVEQISVADRQVSTTLTRLERE